VNRDAIGAYLCTATHPWIAITRYHDALRGSGGGGGRSSAANNGRVINCSESARKLEVMDVVPRAREPDASECDRADDSGESSRDAKRNAAVKPREKNQAERSALRARKGPMTRLEAKARDVSRQTRPA